jgi:hypothetical protein
MLDVGLFSQDQFKQDLVPGRPTLPPIVGGTGHVCSCFDYREMGTVSCPQPCLAADAIESAGQPHLRLLPSSVDGSTAELLALLEHNHVS